MAFAKVPLSFLALQGPYPDNKSLPADAQAWLDKQVEDDNRWNREERPGINEARLAKGLERLGERHSTSCCMQMSIAFNHAGCPIPPQGLRGRPNTPIGGRYNILAVDEFNLFMTSRFGSTDTFGDWSEIKGKTGIVIFGIAHIELFDGDYILQSAEGLKRYSRPSSAIMSGAFIEGASARPRYFWELVGDNSEPENPDIPQWLLGWWTVYDTNYYYYYFFADGTVIYIEQPPNLAWVPPKAVHNRGVCIKDESVHGFKVTWNLIGGETIKTEERFTPLGWTSQTEMNATSNKYGPLFARKMEIFKKT
jgi:Type VI secretion system (T6SS), amidase effector protein 4